MKLRIKRPSTYIQYVEDDSQKELCDDIQANPDKYLEEADPQWNTELLKSN